MSKENTTALVVDDAIVSAPENVDKVEKSELDTLKEQIEEKDKALERERHRAETAEREREEYSHKLSVESTEKIRAQGNSIESMIAAKQSEAERLKGELKEAHENGKFDEYAELVAEYGMTRQDIKNFETRKAQLATQEESRIQAAKNDPLVGYTPRTQAWIRNNPEFLSDNKFQKRALAAHNLAESEGYVPDTDAYFEYIESYVKPKKVNDDTNDSPAPKKNVSTSLPPSRSGSSSSSSGQSKQIRLTPDEVDHAIWAFPKLSPADAQNVYYKNKMELIKEEKMGRN